MQDKEAKSTIEALLFMAAEPLTLDTFKKILEIDKKDIEGLVGELTDEYRMRDAGVFIAEIADGVQMVTNPACGPWVKKLLATDISTRLTQQSLETLSIIAYKQPITKAEIEALRGVNSDGVIKTLLERRLVKIIGRKEVPGRPLMYGTTKEFLQGFGLKNLSELPTLKEFREVEDAAEPAQQLEEDTGLFDSASDRDLSQPDVPESDRTYEPHQKE
jgi:segregation and condensation protein B